MGEWYGEKKIVLKKQRFLRRKIRTTRKKIINIFSDDVKLWTILWCRSTRMVLRIPYSRTPRGHVIIIVILLRTHSAAKDYDGDPNDRSANMKRGTVFGGGGNRIL